VKILFRTFVTQFFTSETVTSDVQMRQAMIGVLAFVLTPCLILLPSGFGQFQQLSYGAHMRFAPAVIARLNAVRALALDDMTEAAVALLTAYSMITVGLVAVYAWDALTFDRRDAMVLGPLPVAPSTIMTAKLAALGALLVGASLGVGGLNSTLFALESADRLGAVAFLAHFFACLAVTTAAAVFVFAVVLIARAIAVMLGGERLAAVTGSVCQLLFVVALLGLLVVAFGTPRQSARLAVTQTTTPPITWFVALFEVLRGSPRGQWDEVIAMGRRALVLAPGAALAALTVSVLTFRHQMRRALTPSANVGPIGAARLSRAIARTLCAGDRFAHAVGDFVLTTIVRNRAQQVPIAMNAGIGVAFVAAAVARSRGHWSAALAAAPLMCAFWIVVGLRASFFVPSELPAAWTFLVNAPPRFASYARGVRAAIVAIVAPPAALAAWFVGGWAQALLTLLLVAALADAVVLTFTFVPFTRAYRPGHAKLRTRWPLYAIFAVTFAYGLPRVGIAVIAVAVVMLEVAVTRFADRRWRMLPRVDELGDETAVTTLDLIGGSDVETDADVAPRSSTRACAEPG